MNPIERLFERDGLPRFGLPVALATSYVGDFGLSRPALYANFVWSWMPWGSSSNDSGPRVVQRQQ
jgi:hypothetical protein